MEPTPRRRVFTSFQLWPRDFASTCSSIQATSADLGRPGLDLNLFHQGRFCRHAEVQGCLRSPSSSTHPCIDPLPDLLGILFREHHMAVAVDASFAQLQVNLLAASCLFQESNSTMILRRRVICFSSDGQSGQRCSAAVLVFSLPARHRILWCCRALNWTMRLLRARGQREDR